MNSQRFEVRAVYNCDARRDYIRSYTAQQLDAARDEEGRDPDQWGVYHAHSGGWVFDYTERAAADAHAAQLNGETS